MKKRRLGRSLEGANKPKWGMLVLNELKDLFPFNPRPTMKTFKVKCTKGLPAIASSGEAGIQSSLPVIKLPYAQLFHPVKFIQKRRPPY